MKKGDINKGKCVHITTLLLQTKVLDVMLFCGPLTFLTKPGFTAVDAFVTQYYRKLVCTALYYGLFDVYCLHKFSKYSPNKLCILICSGFPGAGFIWVFDVTNPVIISLGFCRH